MGTVNAQVAVTPFVKWAGGKRWFVSNYPKLIPKSFRRYVEPFLGSGAVFFHVAPGDAYLSDLNSELVNAFNVIKRDWRALQSKLKEHQKKHSKYYYYEIRSLEGLDDVESAARFIYLNRTCWNGLYRVNRQGKFNVPIGSRSSILLKADDFKTLSVRLKSARIEVSDFERSIDGAGENDLIFVDPPYTVKHNLNGFIKYNDQIFSWEDQVRLSQAIRRARNRGAMIVMTNANHQSIKNLYRDEFSIKVVSRTTSLAADSTARGRTTELVITTY